MRTLIVPAVLAVAMAGSPALAQSGQQQSGGQQKSQASAMSQQKLKQSLQQAGFKNIQVLDTAYLVQAQTQDGDTILMTINPPSTTAAAGSSGSGSSGSGSGSGGSKPPGQQ